MIDDIAVQRLVAVLAELGPSIVAAGRPESALAAITERSLVLVSGAQAASISRPVNGGFESFAPTGDLAKRVDAIQHELGSGPCVDAALTSSVFRTDDLRSDSRWPQFSRRATDETDVASMLAIRMFFEEDDYIAALNLYSVEPKAFDRDGELTGLVLASYGALAVTSARRLDKIVNLERALASNRDIGVAIGVLMGLHRISRDQAFDLLRVASQGRHRKLVDLARDVAETGTLDLF